MRLLYGSEESRLELTVVNYRSEQQPIHGMQRFRRPREGVDASFKKLQYKAAKFDFCSQTSWQAHRKVFQCQKRVDEDSNAVGFSMAGDTVALANARSHRIQKRVVLVRHFSDRYCRVKCCGQLRNDELGYG